jgi:hypothetical protein
MLGGRLKLVIGKPIISTKNKLTSLSQALRELTKQLKTYHQEYVNHVDNRQTKGCLACEAINTAEEALGENK